MIDKQAIIRHFDAHAAQRPGWFRRNHQYHEQMRPHPELDIRFMPQVAPQAADADAPPDLMLKRGKGDAVRKGFAAASGDILMILDSDLTMPPEELPKIYDALISSNVQLVNGTRFVYGQEAGAMRELNRWGNVFFSQIFSWLLGQPVTDTLYGTKALYKHGYEAIVRNRAYFGDFDPFGDFDLLFGAARLRYRIIDLPIRYRERVYGDSKVRVGIHGPLLGCMSLIALWQLKIRPVVEPIPSSPDVLDTPTAAPSGWMMLAGLVGLLGLFLLFDSGRSHRKKPSR